HVRRAWTDRRGGDHDLAAAHRLRIGDRRERHALLVLAADRGQLVAHLVEREAKARDVAVPEDRKDAGEKGRLAPVNHRPLRDQVADDRLRCGQPHGSHVTASRTGTTVSQVPDSQERTSAAWTATKSRSASKPGSYGFSRAIAF